MESMTWKEKNGEDKKKEAERQERIMKSRKTILPPIIDKIIAEKKAHHVTDKPIKLKEEVDSNSNDTPESSVSNEKNE